MECKQLKEGKFTFIVLHSTQMFIVYFDFFSNFLENFEAI